MVFRYCFGMIMSVSTLMIFSGAATPSSVVNLSMVALPDEARGGVVYRERGPNPRPNWAGLVRSRFDRLHIVVRKAEMVADLVDQHVTDDTAECLLMFRPVVQDRPPIEP